MFKPGLRLIWEIGGMETSSGIATANSLNGSEKIDLIIQILHNPSAEYIISQTPRLHCRDSGKRKREETTNILKNG